jgi:Ran GTPase-activating protein (RanGAP) involved in mRNA processing and transport
VLAVPVAAHPAIESLDLHGVALTAEGVRAVTDALLANHASLKHMDLSMCTIDNAGAAVLASRLAQNTTLVGLSSEKKTTALTATLGMSNFNSFQKIRVRLHVPAGCTAMMAITYEKEFFLTIPAHHIAQSSKDSR